MGTQLSQIEFASQCPPTPVKSVMEIVSNLCCHQQTLKQTEWVALIVNRKYGIQYGIYGGYSVELC